MSWLDLGFRFSMSVFSSCQIVAVAPLNSFVLPQCLSSASPSSEFQFSSYAALSSAGRPAASHESAGATATCSNVTAPPTLPLLDDDLRSLALSISLSLSRSLSSSSSSSPSFLQVSLSPPLSFSFFLCLSPSHFFRVNPDSLSRLGCWWRSWVLRPSDDRFVSTSGRAHPPEGLLLSIGSPSSALSVSTSYSLLQRERGAGSDGKTDTGARRSRRRPPGRRRPRTARSGACRRSLDPHPQ